MLIGAFRSEDEDDYEYEFSVLSTRTSKPYAHAQYGKLVLVLVLILRSKDPYFGERINKERNGETPSRAGKYFE